jgi:hypothetical protein
VIPGIEFTFGDDVRVFPPLTLGALELLQKRLLALNNAGTQLAPEHMATIIDAAHLALKRNYPTLTREQVAEMIDLGNMHDVLLAVTDVSGIRRKAQAALGETTPQTGSRPAG